MFLESLNHVFWWFAVTIDTTELDIPQLYTDSLSVTGEEERERTHCPAFGIVAEEEDIERRLRHLPRLLGLREGEEVQECLRRMFVLAVTSVDEGNERCFCEASRAAALFEPHDNQVAVGREDTRGVFVRFAFRERRENASIGNREDIAAEAECRSDERGPGPCRRLLEGV